ncbi:uncharacterized protein L969DRAFT_44135 [Mixia osmundae IAM 14324]|uniref:uncharacterized protein n=1 Tax=Mixia osmundae (strain CBS 9802 / IAM 14324 / JCM 22182 / KY 12970) TaxID=764103 RepID=UPI0004A552C2|nr:uncharacterized protein L969DRAFT_44135 [Mixia osmundae IAM 14324]KEI41901.1 hypothetical protein L969DRAFT_44135 [Mixia osmundae IAM 14324]
MSFFDSDASSDPVRLALDALLARDDLALLKDARVIYRANPDPHNVSIISGGGSGHEPLAAGYVGRGMLTGAVSGDIFASPSTKQVFAAIRACASDAGTLLLILNYTGDVLHFNLAAQKARAEGQAVQVVAISDDVAVGRAASELVGRRGLAGMILAQKICGAAAEAGQSLHQLTTLAQRINANMVSIGASLDHCHVPGSLPAHLKADEIELGMGIHNEPGFTKLSPSPKPAELVARMLGLLLKQDDEERSFVRFAAGDQLVLLVNNLGGLSNLELSALTSLTLSALAYQPAEDQAIHPVRVLSGTFLTSLDGSGFSITLLNISSAASDVSSNSELLDLLDAPAATAAWSNPSATSSASASRDSRTKQSSKDVRSPQQSGKVLVSASVLYRAISGACETLEAQGPQLTRWDTIVGDGDCGRTCEQGAQAVLKLVNSPPHSSRIDIGSFVHDISEAVEDACGGTLGAIFAIFLAALANELLAVTADSLEMSTWAACAARALETLEASTLARQGHRTIMDALIPFVETFTISNVLRTAVSAAITGAEGTKNLKAKLGRAAYIGEREGTEVPDPGAMAVAAILSGLMEAFD